MRTIPSYGNVLLKVLALHGLISVKMQGDKKLVDGYFDIVRSTFAMGLGALYAYERQAPKVSKSKIEGLKKHYLINDGRSSPIFYCLYGCW